MTCAMLLGTGLESVPAVIEYHAVGNESLNFEYINLNELVGESTTADCVDGDSNNANTEELIAGCACNTSNCYDDALCSCLHNSSGKTYDNHGRLVDFDPFTGSMRFLRECNSLCNCLEDQCPNRVIQHGVLLQMSVFHTGTEKGLGVRTLEKIPKNTFVCEYTGQTYTIEKSSHITSKSKSRSSCFNYILSINEYFGDFKMSTVIDASTKGNVSRLINHSCDPNLFMVPVRVNHMVPHAALFALKDIEPGDELSYNYSGCLGNLPIYIKESELSNKKLCLCRSTHCSYYLPS